MMMYYSRLPRRRSGEDPGINQVYTTVNMGASVK
jgi:hypothetical protein